MAWRFRVVGFYSIRLGLMERKADDTSALRLACSAFFGSAH